MKNFRSKLLSIILVISVVLIQIPVFSYGIEDSVSDELITDTSTEDTTTETGTNEETDTSTENITTETNLNDKAVTSTENNFNNEILLYTGGNVSTFSDGTSSFNGELSDGGESWNNIAYSDVNTTNSLVVNYSLDNPSVKKLIKIEVPKSLILTGQPQIGSNLGEVEGISTETSNEKITYIYDLGYNSLSTNSFTISLKPDYEKLYDGLVFSINAYLIYEGEPEKNLSFSINGSFLDYNLIKYDNNDDTTKNEIRETFTNISTDVGKEIPLSLNLQPRGARLNASVKGTILNDYKFVLDLNEIRVGKNGGALRKIYPEELASISIRNVIDEKHFSSGGNRFYSAIYDVDTKILTYTAPEFVHNSELRSYIVFSKDFFDAGDIISLKNCVKGSSSYMNADAWGGRDGVGRVPSVADAEGKNEITNHLLWTVKDFTLTEPVLSNEITVFTPNEKDGTINTIENVKKYNGVSNGAQELISIYSKNKSNFDFTDLTLTVDLPDGITVTEIFSPSRLMAGDSEFNISVNGQSISRGSYIPLDTPLTGSFDIVIDALPAGGGYTPNPSKHTLNMGIRLKGLIPNTATNGDEFLINVKTKSATYKDESNVLHDNSTELADEGESVQLIVKDTFSVDLNVAGSLDGSNKERGIRYLNQDGVGVSQIDYNAPVMYLAADYMMWNYPYTSTIYYVDNLVAYVSIPENIIFKGRKEDVFINGVSGIAEVTKVADTTAEGRSGDIYKLVMPKDLYIGRVNNGMGIANKDLEIKLKVSPNSDLNITTNVNMLETDVLLVSNNPDITGLTYKGVETQTSAFPNMGNYIASKQYAKSNSFALNVPSGVSSFNSIGEILSDNELYFSSVKPDDVDESYLNSYSTGTTALFRTRIKNAGESEAKDVTAYFLIPRGNNNELTITMESGGENVWNPSTINSSPNMFYTLDDVSENNEWILVDQKSEIEWLPLELDTEVKGITAVKYVFETMGATRTYNHIMPLKISNYSGADIYNEPLIGKTIFKVGDITAYNLYTAAYKLTKSDPPTVVPSIKDEVYTAEIDDLDNITWHIAEVTDDLTKDLGLDMEKSIVTFAPFDGGEVIEEAFETFQGISSNKFGIYTFNYMTNLDDDGQYDEATVKIIINEKEKEFFPPKISFKSTDSNFIVDGAIKKWVIEVSANLMIRNIGFYSESDFLVAGGIKALNYFDEEMIGKLVTTFSEVNQNQLGSYTVELLATDENGLTASDKVIIEVVDTVAPVISVNSIDITITPSEISDLESLLNLLDASANDKYEGVVSIDSTNFGTFDFAAEGTSEVNLVAKDSSGNQSSVIISVTVEEENDGGTTEPTNPTTPSKPYIPVKPTEPVEPQDPTEPKDPVEPQDPTDKGPVEPQNPTDKGPVEPQDPIEPKEPVEPQDPTEPQKPFEPQDPTEPQEPFEPQEPTEPQEPFASQDPTEPQEPLNPVNVEDLTFQLGDDGLIHIYDKNGFPLGYMTFEDYENKNFDGVVFYEKTNPKTNNIVKFGEIIFILLFVGSIIVVYGRKKLYNAA